jgi:flavin-dependent dehydrogenase
LDEAIVQAAVESGARLVEEARVTGYETDSTGVVVSYQHRGAQQRLRARLLIGADGSASLMSRILRGAKPPRRDRIVAIRAYFDGVEGPADQADLHVNASSAPGYSWVFPTGASSANVGLTMPLEAYAPARLQLGELLMRIIEADPTIRRRLARAKVDGKISGWPLTTYNPRLPIIADRVALIGDAAGLINPLSGEGIQYALRSASWIAEALHHPVASDDLTTAGLRPYAARVQAEMRYDMALSRFLVDLSKNRSLNPLWLSALQAGGKRAASDAGYFDTAAGLFAGIVPASELLTPTLGWRAVKAAARTGYASALDALRGSKRVRMCGATPSNAVGSMFKDSVEHPVASIRWCIDCALSALELATQMAISAVDDRRRGAEHHSASDERSN